MSVVLGLNAYHGDSSACVVVDGEIIAAAEEERFLRIKHWAGFPAESVKYCLNEAGISLSEVTDVAINQNRYANLLRKGAYVVKNRPSLSIILNRIQNQRQRISLKRELHMLGQDDEFKGKIHYVEHHLAHIASSYYPSGFDEAVIVSVDGFGDFSSTKWGHVDAGKITISDGIFFPHSLGIFYQAMTQYLGFYSYGDEYKVMGLAPYRKNSMVDELSEILCIKENGRFELNLKYFRHYRSGFEYTWLNGEPKIGKLFEPALEDYLGNARSPKDEITQFHIDLAGATQEVYEKAFFEILNHAYSLHASPNLALSGGCAMNSVANGKITDNTPFQKLYVPAAAGDAGGAIGAALTVACRGFSGNKDSKRTWTDTAYLGPQYSEQEITQCIQENAAEFSKGGCDVNFFEDESKLCEQIARYISNGKVIGWFQGRMEWGPRALGNRSILADPRRDDVKDLLNIKIKRREKFRPFAPSILRECVQDWFEKDDDVPFMMQVFKIKHDKQQVVPGVTHVDGTGRLQTVSKQSNLIYYNLIKKFYDITGVPMLLNTSFNENEPIVCTPAEAVSCFMRTNMDAVVIGQWVVQRKQCT